MKLLILGGTRFVGRHLVEAALARGHEITLFHRGRHEAHFSAEVEELHGDRRSDLSALQGRRWDAVVDTSGYAARDVRASAELLADAVEHYTFVSSISVYAGFNRIGMDENAPVEPPDATSTEMTPEAYGAMKVACEQAVEAAFPEHCAIVRPGLIVGPYDYMDRFPYWCRRIAAGGEVLAPGDPGRPVQLIDVRDLAEWMVRLAEQRRAGVFNATGPAEPLTMRELLEGIRAGVGGDARFTWVPDEFLLTEGVGEWEEMPFWVSEKLIGVLAVDVSRAVAAGLAFRPVRESARDTRAWQRTSAAAPEVRSGLDPERERELLDRWHNRA
ncbi:MAG TPA: SDR family oxidoreductase [Longimicrobiaceae bacterium]|nr:SDR family oxidoreductase [Longimicrobiaceae bacterium]